MWVSLGFLIFTAVLAFLMSWNILPKLLPMLIDAGIFGKDMSKPSSMKDVKVPEASGVITGCVYLITTILMLPVAFSEHLFSDETHFPHVELTQLLSALLSICCMLLLGFADDVLNLRWRHKLFLPSLASLPLLIVYNITTNRTDIVVPLMLRPFLGTNIDLGFFYYIYMGMLAVFCTNAINILAGINGLEVGQSVIIALSVIIFNLKEMDGPLGHYHRFSLYFLFPFVATSLPLLFLNWYPSRAFAGDTFCYFSGMTMAVVAILGHFSKTMLLFFIPQIANFVYSLPQLFHLVPCPRHRLPKYDEKSDTVGMSFSIFKEKDISTLGYLILRVLHAVRLVHLRKFERDNECYMECSNFTIINLSLKFFGPMHEQKLTVLLLCFQIFCSVIAFIIRYPLALLFYDEIIA